MKIKGAARVLIFMLGIGFSQTIYSQVSLIPVAGVNSTRMNDPYFDYRKGGIYGIWGGELSFRVKPGHHQSLYPTLSIGASYLSNGYYYSSSFAFKGFAFYDQEITDLKTRYYQFPVKLRLNWQPFPLVEDWKLFIGAGLSQSYIIEANLHEEYTHAIEDPGSAAYPIPPVTTHYEDRRDVTRFARRQSIYKTFEIGMKYKRIQLFYRLSWSIPDLYFQGLQSIWLVPSENSNYIRTHDTAGVIKEKYVDIMLGYRIGKE